MRNLTVLVADDDPEDFLIFREACQEAGVGIRCSHAADGESLISRLREHCQNDTKTESACPDLILLDLKMPGMKGIDVIEAIKTDQGLRRIPIVVMSGSSYPDEIETCYLRGANSVIPKPSTFEEMITTVKILDTYWRRSVKLPAHRFL